MSNNTISTGFYKALERTLPSTAVSIISINDPTHIKWLSQKNKGRKFALINIVSAPVVYVVNLAIRALEIAVSALVFVATFLAMLVTLGMNKKINTLVKISGGALAGASLGVIRDLIFMTGGVVTGLAGLFYPRIATEFMLTEAQLFSMLSHEMGRNKN